MMYIISNAAVRMEDIQVVIKERHNNGLVIVISIKKQSDVIVHYYMDSNKRDAEFNRLIGAINELAK